MGLLKYDVTKDYLYQQGMEQGQEKAIEIIQLLQDSTMSIEKVVELTGAPLEYVQRMAEKLKR